MALPMNNHKLLLSLALLVILLAVGGVALPWKVLAEKKLIAVFEAQGFRNVHLTVSTLGLDGIALKNVSFGSPAPLTLQDVTIGYSLPDLWHGRLSALVIKGLTLQVHQNDKKWALAGLENWPAGSQNKAAISVPVTSDQLAAIPLDGATLANSNLHVVSPQWQMDVPLQLTWQKLPIPRLSYVAAVLKFKTHEMEINTGEALAEATLHEGEKKWTGQWQIRDIALKGGTTPVPVLQGAGTLLIQADLAKLAGEFKSADKNYRGSFNVEYLLNAPEKSSLTLLDATVPWNSGILSVQNVEVPLAGKKPVEVNLKVQHVSVDALMQMLTGKRASATGTVSGIVPMTIGADGSIVFHQGNLQAEEPGTIVMQPDAIPGDNAQIVLVRDVLKNLHYTHLSIAVDSNKGKTLSILLTLEGNNPDVYKGRPVKLNVHLTGDMLSLVQQSIMPFINPEQLLQ